MFENKYTVLIDGLVVADSMPLDYAMLFAKSLFTEYYNDYKMIVEIKQMDRPEIIEPNEELKLK
jgi:hypothetical protein